MCCEEGYEKIGEASPYFPCQGARRANPRYNRTHLPMKSLGFCKSWFGANRSPTQVLSEVEARTRHKGRKEYTVAVGGFDAPEVIVIVVGTFVPVMFLDVLLREHLEYHFQELKTGSLFLSMATKRVYCPATDEMVAKMQAGRVASPIHPWLQYIADIDKVIEGTSLIFRPDGRAARQYEHFAEPYHFEETEFKADVANHWEKFPEFGQYDQLLKKDRGLPW